MPSRRGDGTLVFKILIYGPPESGVKTVFNNLYSSASDIYRNYAEYSVPSGRKMSFDYISSISSNCIFQVFTLFLNKYNKKPIPRDLRGADAILFIWDSLIEQWSDNIWHLKDLLKSYGERITQIDSFINPEVPLVVLANKRDLDDIVNVSKIRQVFDTARLRHALIYETIAVTGINIKRAFVFSVRQAVLNHYRKLGGPPPNPTNPKLFRGFLENFSTCPVCRSRNHENYLREFFYDSNPFKRNLRETLLKLLEKSKKFDEIYYNQIRLGIPCCSCFKKFFNEHPSIF